jgi:hypothetical protein
VKGVGEENVVRLVRGFELIRALSEGASNEPFAQVLPSPDWPADAAGPIKR